MRSDLVYCGERVDDLQNGLFVIQDPKKFCFGMHYKKLAPHEYLLYHSLQQKFEMTPVIYTYLLLASHNIYPATSFEDILSHNCQQPFQVLR